ncbi:hypothetical protein EN859_016975 [Mesorhizobium sp. M00.F.Ca.ET.216.01.1.1]|nr:hypothetical protein EN859_016975 [Mesorhizobium sp. M00.F.Ca.ET.216.01.1.1]TIS60207.1 MAG: hypothetical protein E5W91_01230 [Mesorhizobium sp.]TIS91282.1 MAG: hypothetical protein E5W89_06930 [Mesorhizobium sp.]TJW04627.1 MAG: hypothetical protein E5W82_30515 [Mesorhizobium sp.]TJW39677.1 MAG: hypothetical protein E5W83_30345 [Mesorhizobium sp.]
MVTKARKPAPGKGRAVQSKTGAGPATAARSKDAKPTFGKAAPKKVMPAAAAAAKTGKRRKPATGSESMADSAMRTVRTTANVAAGAVVATARRAASLAASAMGKRGSKPKSKSKAK